MVKKSDKETYISAKEFYFKIGTQICPALGNERISFDSAGWRHLIWKGQEKRPSEDRINRFNLLRYSRQIVKEGQLIHYSSDIKKGIIGKFWKLKLRIDGRDVKLLVRQIGNGHKHFFSIMN